MNIEDLNVIFGFSFSINGSAQVINPHAPFVGICFKLYFVDKLYIECAQSSGILQKKTKFN